MDISIHKIPKRVSYKTIFYSKKDQTRDSKAYLKGWMMVVATRESWRADEHLWDQDHRSISLEATIVFGDQCEKSYEMLGEGFMEI